jgi:hypothetical protein
MPSTAKKTQSPRAVYVVCDDQTLAVQLADGRRLVLPLEWYPRLKHGTPVERNDWRLIGNGEGIHWPQLDEDLSVEGFLAGRKSGESPEMIRFWLENKKRGRPVTIEDFLKHRGKAKGRKTA